MKDPFSLELASIRCGPSMPNDDTEEKLRCATSRRTEEVNRSDVPEPVLLDMCMFLKRRTSKWVMHILLTIGEIRTY